MMERPHELTSVGDACWVAAADPFLQCTLYPMQLKYCGRTSY